MLELTTNAPSSLLISPAIKARSRPPAMAPIEVPVAEPTWNWVSPPASADMPTCALRTLTMVAIHAMLLKNPRVARDQKYAAAFIQTAIR